MANEEDLIRRTYAAFNARDIDAVLAEMHPDVDWPNGWEGGRVSGHDGVRDYWTRQWAEIDPHVEPTRIEAGDGGKTVVTVHALIRDLDGKVLSDGDVVHVYTIEDGLIHSMDIRQH